MEQAPEMSNITLSVIVYAPCLNKTTIKTNKKQMDSLADTFFWITRYWLFSYLFCQTTLIFFCLKSLWTVFFCLVLGTKHLEWKPALVPQRFGRTSHDSRVSQRNLHHQVSGSLTGQQWVISGSSVDHWRVNSGSSVGHWRVISGSWADHQWYISRSMAR